MKSIDIKVLRSARRTSRLIAVTAAFSLVMTSCGGEPAAEDPAAQETSAEPASPTSLDATSLSPTPEPEPEPAPEPVIAFNPTVDTLGNEELLAISPEDLTEGFVASSTSLIINARVAAGSWGNHRGAFEWQMFNHKEPTPVSLLFEEDTEADVISSAVGAQNDSTSDIAGVFVNHIRTKSHGLEPEGGLANVYVFDSAGSTINQFELPGITEVPGDYDKIRSVAVWGDSAVVAREIPDGVVFAGIDLTTGKLNWKKSCGGEDSKPSVISGDISTIAIHCDGATLGVSIQDGKKQWAKDYTFYGPAGAIMGSYAGVVGGGDPTNDLEESDGLINLKDGTVRWGDSMKIDPKSGLMVFGHDQYSSSGEINGKTAFTVMEIESQKKVYSISWDTYESLGTLSILGIFDGRMWIWTSDGLDVVDARTGKQDAALTPGKTDGFKFTSNVPTIAGKTWVYLSNTNGFGDPSPRTVYRDPSGEMVAEDLPPSEITGTIFDE